MRILILDEDLGLTDALRQSLRQAGHDVAGMSKVNGDESVLMTTKPDILILDCEGMTRDCLNLIKKLRTYPNLEMAHLIVLSAQTDKQIIQSAFDSGADDCFLKPIDIDILLKKIQAIERKIRPQRLEKCGISFDTKSILARINDQPLSLTKTEFYLLFELVRTFPDTVDRKELMQKSIKGVAVTIRTIDVHICYLRRKLRPYRFEISAIRNLGYRLTQKAQ